MRITITAASGFIRRYIVRHLASLGHECSCWFRPESDHYLSELEVATLAKSLSGSRSEPHGIAPQPKNQTLTDKLRALGMTFGGQLLLEQMVRELLAAV